MLRLRTLAHGLLTLGGLAAAGIACAQQAQFIPGYSNPNNSGTPIYGQSGMIASGTEVGMPRVFGSNKGTCNSRSSVKGQPQVVSVFPAKGAVVRPGVVVVRVTYDRPMSCDASFDGNSDLPNPCPGRWREVFLSKDGRSFRTVCKVAAGARYTLTLRSFRSADNVMAAPYAVTFSTAGAAPVASVREALAEDTGAAAVAGG